MAGIPTPRNRCRRSTRSAAESYGEQLPVTEQVPGPLLSHQFALESQVTVLGVPCPYAWAVDRAGLGVGHRAYLWSP